MEIMTEFIHKGGRFIIQDDGQKGLEATYLALFTRHPIGEQWMNDNQITTKLCRECPDFLFKVPDNKIIGLELVNVVVPNNKFKATARLNTIGKKIIGYFKDKNVPLSIVIDIKDPREYSVDPKDMFGRWYDPGVDHLTGTDKEIKEAIIAQLEKQGIPKWGVTKAWVEVKGQTFVVTASRMHEPHAACHVNNSCKCVENPITAIQQAIDSKNKKYDSYMKNCDVCDLLVISDDHQLVFDETIEKHKFKSNFRNVYLFDLSGDTKVYCLQTYKD